MSIIIVWNNSAPWHYAAFLDDAAERILLRKVGGGYTFIHRYLLDYFARLESVDPTQAAPQQRPDRLVACPRGGFIPSFHFSLGILSNRANSLEILNLRGRATTPWPMRPGGATSGRGDHGL